MHQLITTHPKLASLHLFDLGSEYFGALKSLQQARPCLTELDVDEGPADARASLLSIVNSRALEWRRLSIASSGIDDGFLSAFAETIAKEASPARPKMQSLEFSQLASLSQGYSG